MSQVLGARRYAFGRIVAAGVLVAIIGWVGTAVVNLLGGATGEAPWFAVPAVSVLVAILSTLAGKVADTPPTPLPVPGHPTPRPARPTEGTALPVVLAGILILGLVGLVGAYGVRYAVQWATGNEPGTDRLVQDVGVRTAGLGVTVTAFEETRHYTRVHVRVENGTTTSLDLPTFGNLTLTGVDGTAMEPDSWRSDWTESFPPGATHVGELVFKGHLPDAVRTASLGFATVFVHGSGGPRSVVVKNIKLGKPGH